MKRIRRYKRSRKVKPEPSVLAWLLLLIAWLSVVPLSVYIFLIVPSEQAKVSPAFAPIEQETVQTVESASSVKESVAAVASPAVLCTYKAFPALNALRSDKPTILIYHTHTTEAYTQTETETYRETSKWRTSDNTKNVVAVGETLKEILEKDYGFTVIHDTTDHEPPKLATAYDRSFITIEKYHKEYPSVVLFIDLHRDAYTSTGTVPCDYLTINGIETARLMFVVGKGEKYSDKPYYDSNIAFAERMTAYLNTISDKLCRPVRVKTGRYNQHVAPNCILVEVGHNANTLSQAKAAMPYFAESIAYCFFSGSIASSDWLPN
ncbi:MAG: stage II sporulation protein P [Clostridia bacterium]|nr:stage II sporulation protein P [Clostridia bacterium]